MNSSIELKIRSIDEKEKNVLKSQIRNIIVSNIKDNLQKGNYNNNYF